MSEETLIVDTPERLKALADPLRQRLIAVFAEQPCTIKAAAERLGEPLTKLYRHVDQLAAAGFLKVVGEQKRRGAIERTFTTTAQRFVMSSGADAVGRAAEGDALARAALDELLSRAGPTDDPSGRLRLMRARVRMTPQALERFESAVRELMQAHVSDDGAETEFLVVTAPNVGPGR